MEQTILLFEYEYDLPILSPTVAAYSATFAELFFPIFLALGLLSRLAALPLFIMAIVIQTLVIQHPEHFYWMFLLANIMIFGGGKISADNFLPKICNKICKK
jgi:putative oxidoreductase